MMADTLAEVLEVLQLPVETYCRCYISESLLVLAGRSYTLVVAALRPTFPTACESFDTAVAHATAARGPWRAIQRQALGSEAWNIGSRSVRRAHELYILDYSHECSYRWHTAALRLV